MRRFPIVLILVVVLSGCARLWRPDPPRPEPRTRAADPLLDSLQAEVGREVNRLRLRHGVHMLRDDPAIERAAVLYSAELALRGTIGHRSPTPTRQTAAERLRWERVYFTIAGENLARLDERAELVPAQVVDAWFNSPSHQRIMLGREFVRSGVGITLSENGLWYIVQMFAAPLSAPLSSH